MSVVSGDITTAGPEGPRPDGTTWVAESLSPATGELEARFAELAALEPDWDGYGAHAIDRQALREARAAVLHPAFRALPVPEVFPLPSGGVQLEWRAGPLELELEVEPGGATAVFVCDEEGTHYRFDGELPGDEQRFQLALTRLAAHR